MAGKILIVDDVATNRIVLKVKLSGARYETVQAGTGQEALRLVTLELPDLVLLDVQLSAAEIEPFDAEPAGDHGHRLPLAGNPARGAAGGRR